MDSRNDGLLALLMLPNCWTLAPSRTATGANVCQTYALKLTGVNSTAVIKCYTLKKIFALYFLKYTRYIRATNVGLRSTSIQTTEGRHGHLL